MENKYKIRVICCNCDYSDIDYIERGQRISGWWNKQECPNCGCNTVTQHALIKKVGGGMSIMD
jgi:predicted nucleic-acid-binding Zn-ribbon protein